MTALIPSLPSRPASLSRRGVLTRAVPLLAAPALLSACTFETSSYPLPPLRPTVAIDLNRYYGKWYIIGHIPYFAEAGYVGAYATYTPRPAGGIIDAYHGHKDRFSSKLFRFASIDYVQPHSDNAIWRVTVLGGAVGVPFVIFDVDPSYTIALAGLPNRSLGWLFARSNHMDDATYQTQLEGFYHHGFDAKKFRRVPQFPDQIGKPGFEKV